MLRSNFKRSLEKVLRVLAAALSLGALPAPAGAAYAPLCPAVYSSSPALAIPDNDKAGVTDTISVAENFPLGPVNIYVNITHTFVGDLYVVVGPPNGVPLGVTMHARTGTASDDLVGWYNAEIPANPFETAADLSALAGQSPQGVWTLQVSDWSGADTGTLNSWSVELCEIPTPTPTVTVTPTITETFTLSPTATVTPTAVFRASNLGKTRLAPDPALRGCPVSLYFTEAPASSEWTIYNTAGQRIAHLNFGAEADQAWQTKEAAPGVYLVKVRIILMSGRAEDLWQKVVVLP
jgi:subtilisin-like proprotein convertase family protein